MNELLLQIFGIQFLFEDRFAKIASLVLVMIYVLGMFLVGAMGARKKGGMRTATETPVVGKGLIKLIIILHLLLYAFLLTGTGAIKIKSLEPYFLYVGLVIFTFGVLLSIVSNYYLGGVWKGKFVPVVPPSQMLVRTGPYKFIRHPIYLGFFLIWLGPSLMFMNWLGILSAFFIVLPVLYKIADEEENEITGTLGETYFNQMPHGAIFPRLF